MLPPTSSAAGLNRAGCSHARRSGGRTAWDGTPRRTCRTGCGTQRRGVQAQAQLASAGKIELVDMARAVHSLKMWEKTEKNQRPSARASVACSLARSPLPVHVASYVVRPTPHVALHVVCRQESREQDQGVRSHTRAHTRTHARTPTRTQVLVDARWRGWAAQLKALAWVRHTPARARGEAFASPHRPRRPVAFGSFAIQKFRAFGRFLHSDGRFRRCARCWRCCWTAACGASALRQKSRTKE